MGLIITSVIAVSFLIFSIYACCAVSSRADSISLKEDEKYNNYKEK